MNLTPPSPHSVTKVIMEYFNQNRRCRLCLPDIPVPTVVPIYTFRRQENSYTVRIEVTIVSLCLRLTRTPASYDIWNTYRREAGSHGTSLLIHRERSCWQRIKLLT